MIREFRAMGSEWWLSLQGGPDSALDEARAMIEVQEQRFSRFREDSALSRLNRERAISEPELAEVMTRALTLRDETCGAFDPAVGGDVIAAGYDRPFDELPACAPARTARPGGPRITVCGPQVRLESSGTVDLGGIVKGWTADRIGQRCAGWGVERFLVDAGGDILVGGLDPLRDEERIEVGDGLMVGIRAGAVATSTTLLRRWRTEHGDAHHVIAPLRHRPADDRYDTATVIAADATTADALATAVIADPDRGLAALERAGAELLARGADGQWVMTPGLERWLR